MAKRKPNRGGVSPEGIPLFERVKLSEFGKRSTVFDGKRIRYVDIAGTPYYQSLLIGRQNTLALAQYMCNKAHERAMGSDTEIAPIFEWMERFLTIAATKGNGFPQMPLQPSDAMMWGVLNVSDRESFSRSGLWKIISDLGGGNITPNIILDTFDPELAYEKWFVNNPDPNFKYRVLVRTHGNVWVLKYPARYMAVQWMMAYVQRELEEIEMLMDEPESTSAIMLWPSEWKRTLSQIKLLQEAYSIVEACYAEWVEFLRGSGLLGKSYSPELEGIIEAPQERRPPPLLEH